MTRRLRLVMMGTGPFAAPTFRALYASGHEVLALVTQPLRPGPGKKPPPLSPMRVVAQEHGTPIFDPESINTPEAREELKRYAPELFIVADYGQILSPETLAVAPLGGINLHGSLLPKYRGAAPINWALYRGDRETGVTVIHMTPTIDAGPCLAQASLSIDPEEDAVQLEERLAALGAPLVCRTIDDLAAGRIEPIPQDPALTTKARRLRKTDGQIDWTRSAQAIKNQIRALEPWPKTYTWWHRAGGGEPLRLILGHVTVIAETSTAPPGMVVQSSGDRLILATGEGLLQIDGLQPAGKRMLSTADFLRGYPIKPGDRFATEPSDL
jgi:methionyl-tRNA formyltransferase